MSDKIELTEEQAMELSGYIPHEHVFGVLSDWRHHGHIKQNPVEKGHKVISELSDKLNGHNYTAITLEELDTLWVALKYAEKQLEEK